MCKYCSVRKDIIINPSPMDIDLQPNKSIIMNDGLVLLKNGRAYGYININYCPMCGCKLQKVEVAEL